MYFELGIYFLMNTLLNSLLVAPTRCLSTPSPSFLSKNQLAKEGSESVVLEVIPALAPSQDKSLKADGSLCPIRALCCFLLGPQAEQGAGLCL